MTNKNKRTKPRQGSKKAAEQKPESISKAAESTTRMERTQKGLFFTRGQLTALILLSMGISRLFQIGSAIRKEIPIELNSEEASDDSVVIMPKYEAALNCLHFFNGTGNENEWSPSSTCVEDGFNSLLQYKYAMGCQVTALVAGLVLQCWHVEGWLMRLNVGMVVFTPLLPTVASLLTIVPSLIPKKAAWPQVIMAMVLSYLGSPTSLDWIPFVGKRPSLVPERHDIKSLQSLMLMALASLFFIPVVVQWINPLLPTLMDIRSSKDAIADTSAVLLWINNELLTSATATTTPSSLVVVLLLLVDKLTIAFVYFFAWFYFPEQHQRVSKSHFVIRCHDVSIRQPVLVSPLFPERRKLYSYNNNNLSP